MPTLATLGFKKGWIFEAIVATSYNAVPNAAPMGVTTYDMEHIIIRPYKSTQTYTNLVANMCATINITTDPQLFYKTAFKKRRINSLPPTLFVETTIGAPRLRGADAYIEASVDKIEENDQNRANVTCKVERIKIINDDLRLYCRGLFAVLEGIIHTTRIEEFLSKGREDEANRLIEKVKYYQGLIERVSPLSDYTAIMDKLFTRITKGSKS
ncbi:MAG: DUF447 family protein [Candidatus Bathyarchaeota archaeon]|nr:MAG: DUF447 family protein [Candidatus Bathyarchaeota archaeon]